MAEILVCVCVWMCGCDHCSSQPRRLILMEFGTHVVGAKSRPSLLIGKITRTV